MGSVSAMNSLNRVLESLGDELIVEIYENLPMTMKDLLGVEVSLEGNIYEIKVFLELPDGTIELRPYDIDELAERFPDCEIGY